MLVQDIAMSQCHHVYGAYISQCTRDAYSSRLSPCIYNNYVVSHLIFYKYKALGLDLPDRCMHKLRHQI